MRLLLIQQQIYASNLLQEQVLFYLGELIFVASLFSCFGIDCEILVCSKETRTSATSFERGSHYYQKCQAEESQVEVGK